MTIKEFYATVGGDYEDMMSRIPNDALIKRFLLEFLEDENFSALSRAVSAGQREEAFRAAHALKGLCLTLGLSGLGDATQRLSDALRTEFPQDAANLFSAVSKEYEALSDALKKLGCTSA